MGPRCGPQLRCGDGPVEATSPIALWGLLPNLLAFLHGNDHASIATSRAATGTPIPIPICALRLMPDFEALSPSSLTLLLRGEEVGLRSVDEGVGDVGDALGSEVGIAVFVEGVADCVLLLEAGSPDATGIRVDPKVTVVVAVGSRPDSTSEQTNCTALTRSNELG